MSPSFSLGMLRSSLAFVALLAVLVAGCKDGSSTKDRTATPSELLSSANQAFAKAKTVHFRLGLQNGSAALPLGLGLSSAEGDIVMPDRLSAEVKAKEAG